jgi:predicted Zn-dependent protease
VYIHGEPTNEDLDQLRRYLNEINSWLPVQFEITQENKTDITSYQLNIYFVPNEQFKDYGFTEELFQEDGETIGFALPTEGNDVDGLLATTIGIDSTVNQKDRNPTILHELVHALGMYNHFENDTSSILYPLNNQQITTLNETDKTLLDMLYRADIIPGMTEEIRQLWKPRIVE